jgi:hypothetical protein
MTLVSIQEFCLLIVDARVGYQPSLLAITFTCQITQVTATGYENERKPPKNQLIIK